MNITELTTHHIRCLQTPILPVSPIPPYLHNKTKWIMFPSQRVSGDLREDKRDDIPPISYPEIRYPKLIINNQERKNQTKKNLVYKLNLMHFPNRNEELCLNGDGD